MKKVILGTIAILLTVGIATGCSSQMEDIKYVYPESKDVLVTLEEFNKIKTGMTEEEVWEIIGGKCTQTGETSLEGLDEYTTVSYGCNGEGSTGANALLMFQGGKLSTKTQMGLK